MAATGTIALNANSLVVTGSDTQFTTEAQVGGALITYIGNVPYTFVIGAINSDTSIALTANYQGSNVSGQSFSLIDRGAYTAITAELGARTAQAIRGLNYDKANWQQILTTDGNVTVNIPDGSQYTGPSWLSLVNSLNQKANAADYAALNASNTFTGVISTNNSSTSGSSHWSREFKSVLKGYPNSSGTDMFVSLFMNQVDAVDTFATLRVSAYPATRDFTFNSGGNGVAPSGWITNSDVRIKTNINRVSDPLLKMASIRGVSWDRIDNAPSGIGFIAQSVQTHFKESVYVTGNRQLEDGSVVEGVLSPDTSGVAAALHQEAILNLMTIQRKALLTLSDSSLSDEDRQSALTELANLIPDESEYAEQ